MSNKLLCLRRLAATKSTLRFHQIHTQSKMPAPKIRNISPLSPEEAKWTELRKIEWTDQVPCVPEPDFVD